MDTITSQTGTNKITVSLKASRSDAQYTDSSGSFAKFERVDYLTFFAPKPTLDFAYSYTQSDSTSVSGNYTVDANVDEDSNNLGNSVQITFDISSSAHHTHWAMDFGDGVVYPSGVTLYQDVEPTPVGGSVASYIQANWAPATTTTVNHTFTNITQDISRNVVLYLYSSDTSPQKPITESTGNPLTMTIYRDYTNLITWNAAAGSNTLPGVIQGDNQDNATEGLPVDLTPALSSGSINSTHGLRFRWDLGDNLNNQGTQFYVYSVSDIASSAKEVIFTKSSNQNITDSPKRRDISLTITGSNHTSAGSGFTTLSSAGNNTEEIAVWNDVRAIFSGLFSNPSIGYSGANDRKGFLFVDYEGNDRALTAFSDASQNPTTFGWDFGDGTNSTLSNPTHTYTTVGTFQVTLTVQGTLVDYAGILANRTDSDTEARQII